MIRDDVLELARTAVAQRQPLLPEQIVEMVRPLAALPFLSPPLSEQDILDTANQLQREFLVLLGPAHVLVDPGHKPWLRARAHEINFRYWKRYRDYLIKGGFGAQVVNAISDVTDDILDLAGDPSIEGTWSRRGLVVGHVQSGKTANYLGVINKAADAGYKLIILIAGIHSNLRSQTQERVDLGFVGRDSDQLLNRQVNARHIGVGSLNPQFTAAAFTSRAIDFRRNRADGLNISIHNLADPAIFVIKKNPAILANLIEWLRSTSSTGDRLMMPLLVIDDEADNASVNIAKDPALPNTINRRIRELLSLSTRNTYIGYTATPFANIFIDPDIDTDGHGKDLFPRDFIIGLDAPTNYVGAREYFLEDETERLAVELEGTEDWLPTTHRIEVEVESLHSSLVEAIGCFVVSKAIRILRGQGERHHSMLVNVSRFTRVQSQIARLIRERLVQVKEAVENRYAVPMEAALRDPVMQSLYQAWEKYYGSAPEQWPEVQAELHRAAAGMTVVEVNASKNSDTLDYRAHADTGLNVIAVGGNSLSRGFTLEGLTVSYFLRNTQMYDTLLQMGRWFGYRDGYGDLCRLFLKPDARAWYAFIAAASEELRDEIRRMEAVGLTPADFGLAVRSHPGTLLVTARNKMRTASQIVREVGLAAKLVESSVLYVDDGPREFNVTRVKTLVTTLEGQDFPQEPVGDIRKVPGKLFRKVPVGVVVDFISAFVIHPGNIEMQTGPLLDYIQKRGFQEWDVVLVSSSTAGPDEIETLSTGTRIGLQVRQMKAGTLRRALNVSGKSRRVASRGIEKEGLTPEEIELAKTEHRKAHSQEKAGKTIADHFFRHARTRPLLMLHLLRARSDDPELPEQLHAAYGISFPGLRPGEKETPVVYTANLIAFREIYGGDDDERDEEDDLVEA